MVVASEVSVSVLLTQAADHLAALAEGTSPAPWWASIIDGTGDVYDSTNSAVAASREGGCASEEDSRWIATLSPVVAAPLAAWLRQAAASIDRHLPAWRSGVDRPRTEAQVAEIVEGHYGHALAVARAVLGVDRT